MLRATRGRGAARLLLVLSLAGAVLGCETTPETIAVDDPARAFSERQQRVSALEAWTAVGKIAVTSSDDSWNANVLWRQQQEHYQIRLSGPLGQGIMELAGAPGRVAMRTAENEVFEAETPDQLVYEQVGWRIPVSGLRYWILGLAEPRASIAGMNLDTAGRLALLRPSGWVIQFERYDEFDGIALPTRFSLENPRVRVRLVVRSWRIGPDAS